MIAFSHAAEMRSNQESGAFVPMAGIPLFAQGGHEKLTPKKAARAAQSPFVCAKNVFALKNGLGAKKGPDFLFAHAGEKNSAPHNNKKAKPKPGKPA